MPSSRPAVVLVSPGVRAANNGNWRTAWRWSRFLRERFRVDLTDAWSPARSSPECLVALHARRSAASLLSYSEAFPDRPRVLVLTGTDLYRDLAIDAQARRSLELASHLVVLQEAAFDELPMRHRAKCRVIYQSARACVPGKPRARTFDVVMVGHMREEKDPLTPMRAIELLPGDSPLRLIHIGAALRDDYAQAASALASRDWPRHPRYRWLGGLPHAEARRWIREARAMVISSRIEGGANVIVEAVTSGIPVVASRIPGNVGMLGADYQGYFEAGDAAALALLLGRVSSDREFLAYLRAQCAVRAPLFTPGREREAVNHLVGEAIGAG